jgi:hypothetical protein
MPSETLKRSHSTRSDVLFKLAADIPKMLPMHRPRLRGRSRAGALWILWRTFKGAQELNALVRSPRVVAEDQSKQSPGSPHAFSEHVT